MPIPLDRATGLAFRASRLAVVRTDPVEAAMAAGAPIGTGWAEAKAKSDGTFEGGVTNGGYLRFVIDSPSDRLALLEAQGHSFAYVNGEPRGGDVYSTGYVSLPIRLKRGPNELLFRVARGRFQGTLLPVQKPMSLDARDATLPDRIAGRKEDLLAAIVVRNATGVFTKGLTIEASSGGRRKLTLLGAVPTLGVRKVGFTIPGGTDPKTTVRLLQNGREIDRTVLALRSRGPRDSQRRTFRSGIDGSVQYYALVPASRPDAKALVLSLHGASVEAQGQAEAYSPKSWATIVCPTNRRPFGYDWEDWGRQDAMEVLALAQAEWKPDPARLYLTGHSMGGHGTWHLGILDPDRWAAIAPSAGWATSYGYAGGLRPGNDPIGKILARAGAPGDPPQAMENLAGLGVFVLHGDVDDTVPVSEAREMARRLGLFHRDWEKKEIPGANHWWDNSPEPGADAVDDADLFAFLARRQRPLAGSEGHVRFVTFDPTLASRRGWARIEAQERARMASRFDLRLDPLLRRITGTTENVARLVLSPEGAAGSGEITLDGQKLAVPGYPVALEKVENRWMVAGAADPAHKTPERAGPLRAAYDRRFVLVYGTGGSARENAWAYAKARYDAEVWWTRGNGECDLLSDREFDARRERERSVILYGNAETNRAWASLLQGSPVGVRRGAVTLGARTFVGDDAVCAFVRPRSDSSLAQIAVIAPTGPAGEIVANNLPVLAPMLGFPDAVVIGSEGLTSGLAGVRAAGFFGRDWSVERGEFAFVAPVK